MRPISATDRLKMWTPSSVVCSRTAPSHPSFHVEKGRQVISCGVVCPPHFKDLLLKSLQEVPTYVLLFDETYNPVTKDKQMDIFVRYWTHTNCITSVYVTSVFTGHGRSDDMLQHFMSATAELDLAKALQVSMDGLMSTGRFTTSCKRTLS